MYKSKDFWNRKLCFLQKLFFARNIASAYLFLIYAFFLSLEIWRLFCKNVHSCTISYFFTNTFLFEIFTKSCAASNTSLSICQSILLNKGNLLTKISSYIAFSCHLMQTTFRHILGTLFLLHCTPKEQQKTKIESTTKWFYFHRFSFSEYSVWRKMSFPPTVFVLSLRRSGLYWKYFPCAQKESSLLLRAHNSRIEQALSYTCWQYCTI